MTPASKKQLSTVLSVIGCVLGLIGAVLMADHSLELEKTGSFLAMLGSIMLMAYALLKRNTQQCGEPATEQ
jgi:drug/metabolite transporter (DMT)-like permease